jgi:hypothetical protein
MDDCPTVFSIVSYLLTAASNILSAVPAFSFTAREPHSTVPSVCSI